MTPLPLKKESGQKANPVFCRKTRRDAKRTEETKRLPDNPAGERTMSGTPNPEAVAPDASPLQAYHASYE